MWRAVDREGEVVDVLVQRRRNKIAVLKLLRKQLKNQGASPEQIITDGLASYRAAMKVLGCQHKHQPGRLRNNNRVKNSHLPGPTTRAQNVTFQVPGAGAALRLHPLRDLQHLQYPAPPRLT